MSTRAEHLAWAKERALDCLPDAGSVMSSLMQDFAAHPDTADSVDLVRELMFPLAMTGEFENPRRLRDFVEGFK